MTTGTNQPRVKLGCIADDFTGATDLANNLVRAGMRVVQTIGVPSEPMQEPVDAVVVALKSRTIPAAEAVAQSLEALRWLQAQGAQQIYFKYCSTFDSTPQGNIGPVTEALMDALGTDFTVATPAFPDNKRTVFKGYLFAVDVLLNESGMQNHPLTPMTDPNLVRVLQAVVSGSCSAATNAQVLNFIQSGRPALAIDPLRIAAGVDVCAEALAWAQPHLASGPVLIYSTAEPRDVKAIQGQLGAEQAGAMVERTIADIARGLVARGVQQLVVAGGETSGACVQALGIAQMRIGPQIDPGVPWCHALPDAALPAPGGLHITLKSGNFGTPDFFTKAFRSLVTASPA